MAKPGMRKFVLVLLAAAAIAGAGSYIGRHQGAMPWASAATEGQQHGAAPHPATPVQVGRPELQTVPIIVRGLGTVQAYNTATIKSRVDGNIVAIDYREGQLVHKGERLIQLDPRSFQAQLAQAQANLAKDQANLENARRDLARYAALVGQQLAVTRQQYDTQKALVAQLTATTEADEAQVKTAQLKTSTMPRSPRR